MPRKQSKRGWSGDSAGHAAAGRKGGLAKSANRQNSRRESAEFQRNENQDQDNQY